MGMFASADSVATRYAQIYIEAPDGARYPIFRLTPEHARLLDHALWYPKRENFIPFANAIRATQWASAGEKEMVGHFSRKGDLIRKGPESYELLSPLGLRPEGAKTPFAVLIDYRTMSYDVADHTLRSQRVSSFRFERTE